jgi:hypothetical protein
MTTFDKREEGFEKKFALDEELKFKAEARRNRLLGLWAAEKLGIAGDAATAYAREAVAGAFAEGGDKAVVARLVRDLSAKGVTEAEIGSHMGELLTQAVAQVKAGV